MSTHNICFHREIRKILCGYPLLSEAMKCSNSRWINMRFCNICYKPMINIAGWRKNENYLNTVLGNTKRDKKLIQHGLYQFSFVYKYQSVFAGSVPVCIYVCICLKIIL